MKQFILFMVLYNIGLASNYAGLLFDGNCVTCHHKTKAISAPSIKEVRENYLRAFPNKDDFVLYMSNWVESPNEQTSIMQEAILKYGLMPMLSYDKATLKEISAYIYDMKFD